MRETVVGRAIPSFIALFTLALIVPGIGVLVSHLSVPKAAAETPAWQFEDIEGVPGFRYDKGTDTLFVDADTFTHAACADAPVSVSKSGDKVLVGCNGKDYVIPVWQATTIKVTVWRGAKF